MIMIKLLLDDPPLKKALADRYTVLSLGLQVEICVCMTLNRIEGFRSHCYQKHSTGDTTHILQKFTDIWLFGDRECSSLHLISIMLLSTVDRGIRSRSD